MTPTQTALVERLRAGDGSLYVCPFVTWAWGPAMRAERVKSATVKSLERQRIVRLEGGRLPVAVYRLTEAKP